MATVKSLKEQNKLLAQQEERWVDIKRKADAQLKTLEKGTKEYIAQVLLLKWISLLIYIERQ